MPTALAAALESPTRRALLRCLAAALGATATPGALAAAASASMPDELLAVLEGLTGVGLSSPQLGGQYLDALRDNLDAATLQALVATGTLSQAEFLAASQSAPLQEAAEFAMLLWITGMTPASARHGASVLAYANAPVWQTVRFTKPPGQCGGAFGYWSQAPQT